MKKIKIWHVILTLLICPLIVGIILKYLPGADKPDMPTTMGDYSPGVVEGDYHVGDSVAGDKIEAENVNIYADLEMATDVENSIKKVSHDGENIRINVYERESNKMKEVILLEGEIYTSHSRKGARIDYMRKEDKLYVEYTSPGKNWTAYYVTDFEGNIIDAKFPYDLEEYTVEIPEELELGRQEISLSNGWKHIHVDLKWDKSVDLIYDGSSALKQISVKGGSRVSHKDKKIIIFNPRRK